MGHWGVRSYENDDAADTIDAAMERVHGDRYEELMDDRNPLSFDQVQQELASPETLASAVAILREEVGTDRSFESWDETHRLAFAGVIVRHAELGVIIPADWLDLTAVWLETESIDWETDATRRRLCRQNELKQIRKQSPRP